MLCSPNISTAAGATKIAPFHIIAHHNRNILKLIDDLLLTCDSNIDMIGDSRDALSVLGSTLVRGQMVRCFGDERVNIPRLLNHNQIAP